MALLLPSIFVFALFVASAVLVAQGVPAPASPSASAGDVRWADLPVPVQRLLAAQPEPITEASFAAWVARVRAANAVRLRDGDFDHLVHYALQSTRFTSLPPIEPALSAKAFVAATEVRRDARARLAALAKILAGPSGAYQTDDARLTHFRNIVGPTSPTSHTSANGAELEARLLREYERAMRFLYEKEFVAGRAADSTTAVASLYQSRGHSSDTEIEAGYAVYIALATLKQLEPTRKIGRVLIVGPGLDLAPRTALLEEADPQSYQPFAVADALLALGLANRSGSGPAPRNAPQGAAPGPGHAASTLRIDAVDLNPHVARAIERAVRGPALRLFVTSGIADTERSRLTNDYRAYLETFGRAIGRESVPAGTRDGHVRKAIGIAPEVQSAIRASQLDVVTQRLNARGGGDGDGATVGYDLVIVTNVFPYLSDAELVVALANIAAALAPGGVLIHNEARPLLLTTTTAIGLPAIQARTLLLATVPGGRDLYDTVWLHRKR